MKEEYGIDKRKVELAFPKVESQGELIPKGGNREGLVKHLSTSIDQITDWFKQ